MTRKYADKSTDWLKKEIEYLRSQADSLNSELNMRDKKRAIIDELLDMVKRIQGGDLKLVSFNMKPKGTILFETAHGSAHIPSNIVEVNLTFEDDNLTYQDIYSIGS